MTHSIEPPPFEQIARRIEPQGKLLRTWQLMGGISAHMTALEIALPDGHTRKFVVRQPNAAALRQNPHAARDEFHLLQALQTSGVTVPMPYLLDDSGTPYFVMAYVEGSMDFNPPALTAFMQQFAAQLARIHQINRAHPALSFLPERPPDFPHLLHERLALLKHGLNKAQIQQLAEIVAHLPQLNPTVLLHGDFWAGNVLWQNGQLVAVVDWEDAHFGDPVADFAISRLDTAMIFGREAMHIFTQQYQGLMPAMNFTHLPYWDLYAALRAAPNLAAWSADYPQLGRPDITEQTMQAAHRWFVDQLFAALPLH